MLVSASITMNCYLVRAAAKIFADLCPANWAAKRPLNQQINVSSIVLNRTKLQTQTTLPKSNFASVLSGFHADNLHFGNSRAARQAMPKRVKKISIVKLMYDNYDMRQKNQRRASHSTDRIRPQTTNYSRTPIRTTT